MVMPLSGFTTKTVQAANSFTPRLSAPDRSNEYYYGSKNIFQRSGYGMPNCTAYAYGRAYELLGTAPRLSTGNAGAWWSYNINNGCYAYGSTPRLGAIAVWDKWNNNNGHVAVVEAINGDTVTISESHYSGTVFDTRTIKADSSNYLSSWRFNGYIYIGDFEERNYSNPSAAGTYWGNMTDTTFRPVVQISNPDAVKNVRFAVWTTGDQSDLKWYDANHNGTGGFFRDINFSDFSNKLYICHVYIYGYNGSVQSIEMERLDKNDYSKMNIKGGYWGYSTDTIFRPVVEISNPTSVKKVRFAVWSTDDQSDLKWYDAFFNGVGAYFRDINWSDFKNQRYLCHVYVYGNDGSTRVIVLNTFDTYNAEGGFESAAGGIGSVTINGFAFDKSDINEEIYVHCYLKDSAGKATFLGAAGADQERTDVDTKYSVGKYHGFSKTFTTSLSGTYTIEVSAINVGGGNEVTFLGAKTVTITQPTVYFDSCGGTSCGSMKVINTQPYGTLPISERTGYIFDGWYTEKNGGHKITEDDIAVLTANQTLYAHWTCDHNYEAAITTAATCTGDGVKTFTCLNCGDSYTEVIAATGHTEVIVPGTSNSCTTTGLSEGKKCSVCGVVTAEQIVIPASGHSYDEGTITKEATCTEKGVITYKCQKCSNTYTAEIAAKGHNYEAAIVEATCTEKGYTIHQCSNCNDSYNDSYVEPVGHSYDAGVITQVPTDESTGVKTYTCAKCRTTRTEIIPATGHSYDEGTITMEATCTETGTRTYQCTDCDKTYTEIIPATGHDYSMEVTPPTCNGRGYTTYTCKRCKDCYIDDYVNAKGHSYNEGEMAVDVTCIEHGSKVFTCKDCNSQYTETIPATGHQYTDIVTNPSCTAKGYTTHTCSKCGNSYRDTFTAVAGHSYGEWVTVKDAGCTEMGEKERSCEICGLKEKAVIEAGSHTWDDGIISTEPECENPGIMLYTCTACGETRAEAISAKGHIIVMDEAKVAACTENGFTEGSHCSVCGIVLKAQKEIPAAGHQYGEWKTIEKATCIRAGKKERACSVCGEKETEFTTVTGHDWNDGIITEEATEYANGVKTYTCKTCGEVKTEVIPKIKKEPSEEYSTASPAIEIDAGIFYKITSSNTVEFQKLDNKHMKRISIPDKIVLNGVSFKVTAVAPNALKNNKNITTVTIGRNIKSIGNNAFAGCSRLKKITIRKNVTSIGAKAFYNCKNLSQITIEGKALKTIKARAFKGTSKKMKVIFKSKKVVLKKRLALLKKMKKAGMSKTAKLI